MGVDETYEETGHNEVFADADGTLHSGGAPVSPLKMPAAVDAGALPNADPHAAGHLWNNAGVINVSAG
jgi:hypothetical protein